MAGVAVSDLPDDIDLGDVPEISAPPDFNLDDIPDVAAAPAGETVAAELPPDLAHDDVPEVAPKRGALKIIGDIARKSVEGNPLVLGAEAAWDAPQAAWAGAKKALSGIGQTAQTVSGGAPEASAAPTEDFEQPIGWSDLSDPRLLAKKGVYGLSESSPTIGMSIAGGLAGKQAGPMAAVLGTAAGAAVGDFAQTLGPYYAAALKELPDDPDAAFDLALKQAGASSAFSGASFAMFGIAPFKSAVKNVLFQALGVQLPMAEAGVAAQNVISDRPITEGMEEAAPGAVLMTAGPMAAHAVTAKPKAKATIEPPPSGEGAKGAKPPPDIDPAAIPEVAGAPEDGAPPGDGGAPAGEKAPADDLPDVRDTIGLDIGDKQVANGFVSEYARTTDGDDVALVRFDDPNIPFQWVPVDDLRERLRPALPDMEPPVGRKEAQGKAETPTQEDLDKMYQELTDAELDDRAEPTRQPGVTPAAPPTLPGLDEAATRAKTAKRIRETAETDLTAGRITPDQYAGMIKEAVRLETFEGPRGVAEQPYQDLPGKLGTAGYKGEVSKGSTFEPGTDWQVVPEGAKLPPGLQLRVNMADGTTSARLMPENARGPLFGQERNPEGAPVPPTADAAMKGSGQLGAAERQGLVNKGQGAPAPVPTPKPPAMPAHEQRFWDLLNKRRVNLNNPDKAAVDIKGTPEQAADLIAQAIQQGRVIQRGKTLVAAQTPARAAERARREDLATTVARMGGITDKSIDSSVYGRSNIVPGVGRVYRDKPDPTRPRLGSDDMATRLQEQGWFPGVSEEDLVGTMHEQIDKTLRAAKPADKVYHPEREQAFDLEAARAEEMRQMEEEADKYGIPISNAVKQGSEQARNQLMRDILHARQVRDEAREFGLDFDEKATTAEIEADLEERMGIVSDNFAEPQVEHAADKTLPEQAKEAIRETGPRDDFSLDNFEAEPRAAGERYEEGQSAGERNPPGADEAGAERGEQERPEVAAENPDAAQPVEGEAAPRDDVGKKASQERLPGEQPLLPEDAGVETADEKAARIRGEQRQEAEARSAGRDTATAKQKAFDETPLGGGVKPNERQGKLFSQEEGKAPDERAAPEEIDLGDNYVAERDVGPEAKQKRDDALAAITDEAVRTMGASRVLIADRIKYLANKNILIHALFDRANGLITLAMGNRDLLGSLRHETIHALRDTGALTDEMWKSFEFSLPEWRKKYDIDKHYPGESEEAKNEEAVAEAYRNWASKKSFPNGPAARVFQKISDFFKGIRDYFTERGYKSADDIFNDVFSGKAKNQLLNGKFDVTSDAAGHVIMRGKDGTYHGTFDTIHDASESARAIERDEAAHAAIGEAQKEHATPENSVAASRDLGESVKRMQTNGTAAPFGDERMDHYLSRAWRVFSFPFGLASRDTRFAKIMRVMMDKKALSNTVEHSAVSQVQPYFRLGEASRRRVDAAIEATKLNGYTPSLKTQRVIVRNDSEKAAQLSKKGDIISLNPKESAAFKGIRNSMDNIWESLAQNVLRRRGYDGPFANDPEIQMKAFDSMIADAKKRGALKEAKELEQHANLYKLAQDQKKAGYFPSIRQGDRFVKVTEKQNPDRADLQKRAQDEGYGQSFLSRRGLQNKIDAAKAAGKTNEAEKWTEYQDELSKILKPGEHSLAPRLSWYEHVDTGDIFGRHSDARASKALAARIEELKQKFDPRSYDFDTGIVKDSLKEQLQNADVNMLERAIDAASSGDYKTFADLQGKLKDAIYDNLVADWRKQSRNIPGFSMDVEKVLGSYIRGAADTIGNMRYRDEADRAFDVMADHPDKRMRNYAQNYRDYVDGAASPFERLTQVPYFAYLAGNVMSGVKNLAQLPTLVLGHLQALAGPRAIPALGISFLKALSAVRVRKGELTVDPVTKWTGLSADERAFLTRELERGELGPQAIKDYGGASVTRPETMGNSLPDNRTARSIYRGSKRVGDAFSSVFTVTEGVNRMATLLAAYRLAKGPALERMKRVYSGDENFKALMDKYNGNPPPDAIAELVNQDVNFLGGRINQPEATRHWLPKLLMQFKQYSLNYLRANVKMARQMGIEGKLGVATNALMMWTFAGMMGAPFVEDMNKVLKLAGADVFDWMREAIWRATGSKKVAESVMRGPMRQTGLDLSRGIGQGQIVPDANNWWDLMPLTSTLIGKPAAAIQRYKSGQPIGAAAEALPTGLGNALMGAYGLGKEGYSTRRGDFMFTPGEITPSEKVIKGLGGTPTEFSRISEAVRKADEMKHSEEAGKTSILQRYTRAVTLMMEAEKKKDTDAVAAQRDQMKAIRQEAIEQKIKLPTPSTMRQRVFKENEPLAARQKAAPKKSQLREELKPSENPYYIE